MCKLISWVLPSIGIIDSNKVGWFKEVAPQGEWELVADACKYQNEVSFECLDCTLCLVAPGVAWGDQFILHMLFLDALIEGLQGFVIQCVFLESKTCQSHSVDYFLV